jgi:magnesium transporter
MVGIILMKKYIPELQWQYGYFAVWLVMIVSVIAMLILFKRKKLW